MITRITDYGKKLLNLAKICTNKVKYSSWNNTFTLKLKIIHDICSLTDILPKTKMKAFFTIFKNLVLNNSLLNIDISNIIMNFDLIYYLIRKMYIKWDKTQNKINEICIGVR